MSGPVPVLFREDQRFRNKWLMLLLGLAALVSFGGGLVLIVGQVFLGYRMGTRPLPDIAALLIGSFQVCIGLGLAWLFYAMVLQIEVTARGLFVRFYPFHRKVRQLDLSDATGIHAVSYRPVLQYGGWGLRFGRHHRCYNVSGNQGVRIDYADRNFHLMLGTQHPEALEAALLAIWQATETQEEEAAP